METAWPASQLESGSTATAILTEDNIGFMDYKIGDKIVMGMQRRTFWEWLANRPLKPQYWVVKVAGSGPGSISYIEPMWRSSDGLF